MRNSTPADVEHVRNGEFVPNVMFQTCVGLLVHMKPLFCEDMGLNGLNLYENQRIFETAEGELIVVPVNGLLPIKKHAFTDTATKAKPKREHVKGKRKYEKVEYDPEWAVEVARKNGGWITLVSGGEKVKRYYATGSDWWFDENGRWTGATIDNCAGAYSHMYVPVEISTERQATISTAVSKSINQFAEDAKLGEVMRKAGWKINDGKMPCWHDPETRGTFLFRNGRFASSQETPIGSYRWEFLNDYDIIAYRIVE